MELHKNKILWILYNSIAEEVDSSYKIDDFRNKFKIPLRIVELATESMEVNGLCDIVEESVFDDASLTGDSLFSKVKRIKITQYGIDTVQDWEDEFYDSVVHNVFSNSPISEYEQYLSATSSTNEPPAKEIPASDRYVTIAHNQEYEETRRTLDNAIRQFKEDHRFDNELGQEKTALVSALEGGRKLIDDTKVWLPTAVNTLVEPLRRIDSIYKQAAVQGGVGAIVILALQQILSLFGLS